MEKIQLPRRRVMISLAIFFLMCLMTAKSDTVEYPPIDGFKNNLGQATLGMAGSNFVRTSPAAYSDGAYEMAGKDRPNPMDISLNAHMGRSGQASAFSRNALLAFYAQLVLDEIALMTIGCPPEYEDIALPSLHPLRNLTVRPQVYQRSGYDQSTGYSSGGPRQQINMVSSFLDGAIIYGSSNVWTRLLRSFSGGRLSANGLNITSSFPPKNSNRMPLLNAPIPESHKIGKVDRLFRLGNVKGHENPFLLALQIVWYRWHNKIAGDISGANTSLTDEEVFQAAKKLVIAHFQKITVKDWLPAFLHGNQSNSTSEPLPLYKKYDSRQHPGITHEFQAAMDFRHTFTPGAVWIVKLDCGEYLIIHSTETYQLCDDYFVVKAGPKL